VNQEHSLIDTTEMYLRTVLELEEEGLLPLRARVAARLGQSVPTASQTTARMQRDGLLTITEDRRIELTPAGRSAATSVMRKHRLAECLLVDVIGLDWQLAHEEACRWEHVRSDAVERRVLEILGFPTHSPYGNPIPGLAETRDDIDEPVAGDSAIGLPPGVVALTDLPEKTGSIILRGIAEQLQSDTALLTRLHDAGLQPGKPVPVSHTNGNLRIGAGQHAAELDYATAAHILVRAADQSTTPDLASSARQPE
jgi:DtxR family transcriptional regulator, Mn-dependent transcriptional regulator